MSASEWVALRQQMMTVKDFNLQKDEQAAITAALLFKTNTNVRCAT